MSLCINNELIWVSVPKCASISIETALTNSSLPISYYKKPMFYDKGIHTHIKLDTLHDYFGFKESVCIKRNASERWVSGLRHWWWTMESHSMNPIIPFNEIDNNFIYKYFTDDLINKIYTYDPLYIGNGNGDIDIEYVNMKKELNTLFSSEKNKKILVFLPLLLLSQLFWTCGAKCTHEFDFKKIHLFEEFISNRYNVKFKLPHLNSKTDTHTNIIIDDKFENWVETKFEKRFEKKQNKLI